MMPAFGDELTEAQIVLVIDHVRTFCAERGWPRGDLNLPRPFVTEKAFPENEAVLTTTDCSRPRALVRQSVSVRASRRPARPIRGVRAVRPAPVGSRMHGRPASGTSAPRTSTCCSTACRAGRSCPRAGRSRCRQAASRKVSGRESRCSRRSAPSARCFRATDFSTPTPASKCRPTQRGPRRKHSGGSRSARASWQHRWGRAWSPMVEILGARELEDGSEAEWDVLPQVQVSLSTVSTCC